MYRRFVILFEERCTAFVKKGNWTTHYWRTASKKQSRAGPPIYWNHVFGLVWGYFSWKWKWRVFKPTSPPNLPQAVELILCNESSQRLHPISFNKNYWPWQEVASSALHDGLEEKHPKLTTSLSLTSHFTGWKSYCDHWEPADLLVFLLDLTGLSFLAAEPFFFLTALLTSGCFQISKTAT